ncbi:transport energizing protein, ExbD/TolR family [Leptospira fainei serovar Hurstbridge str. BUT 6]|uniref:Transport energizing protein, ExbD/TolR family n=1 Tax=Leptospira fainei serovar Hurstbridge str. BUT 6 TaxID=1193011 RepID=S3V8N6_9LEPT|nr:biopolymer transporter ExbD [Leptospira fainei]EPG72795.1 transport energizing protein, ExbD/TolR family [Leptospira fainei serovar Hurstbridge str. BUT 6]
MRKSILREEEGAIDLTSFIDVVFILLVFVMLAVSFRKEIRSIPLDLPQVGKGEDPKGERIEIALLPNGTFLWNGANMDRRNLEKELGNGNLKGKEVRFFADESADYGEVVKILDLVRRSGIDSLELAVKGSR